ncbi:MAG: hypothetical protein AB8H80_09330 [Planctomycetota bacterium]
MSMWEYESLAEECVGLVHASDWSVGVKRDAYAAIYSMVGVFDVSFVHFRSTTALQEASFFFCLEVAKHPEYPARKRELDEVVAAGKSHWLSGNGDAPTECLYEPGRNATPAGLWFDATMGLWPKVCAAGLLTGLAAQPVTVEPPVTFVPKMMALANSVGDRGFDVLKMLHGFVAHLRAGGGFEAAWEDVAPSLELSNLAAALAPRPPEGKRMHWVDERFDARGCLEWLEGAERQFVQRWCAVYSEPRT